jgi:metal-responsive CopG/Arc/MetJ family transcriptional regulator
MLTNISCTIPMELLKKIDDYRGDVPRSRFIIRLMEMALSDEKNKTTKLENMIPAEKFPRLIQQASP